MRQSIGAFGAALLVLVMGSTSVSAQDAGEGKVIATHGAWQVRCAEDQKVCIMSQVGKDAQGNDLAELQIRKLTGAKAPDGTEIPAAVQIVTPLGVLLPAGVRIQVDSKKERAAPFELCSQAGCVVRQPMSAEFVAELKGGSNAKLVMIAAPQQEVSTTLSLSGFTKGFNALP